MYIGIEPSWKEVLSPAFEASTFTHLKNFLIKEINQKKIIYPHPQHIFNAFWKTPLEEVKVVILGQDPYHGPSQAHGLSFSVPEGIPHPPSLKNIFKEVYKDDLSQIPKSGNLERWATQGVFLLNATLTVEAGNAGSHQKQGWEEFTDFVIQILSEKRENIVFLLWGSYARAKKALIDSSKHCILEAPHPSPLSAHRGFLGCDHFILANEYLRAKEKPEIEWR